LGQSFFWENKKMSLGAVEQQNKIKVQVCLGTNGIAAGGREVFSAFTNTFEEKDIKAEVTKRACVRQTGCRGFCSQDVIVDITTPKLGKYSYAKVKPEMVSRLVEDHIKNNTPVKEWVLSNGEPNGKMSGFMEIQERRVLRNCGSIDPESIDDYLEQEGYQALQYTFNELTREKVIEMVKTSGLRGRGGAGFPAGEKWEICANTKSDQKYIVCNAMECDPGTFKDRSIMEGDPHSIIEGMVICGYAVGATEGFLCVNPDYKLAYERLEKALKSAEEKNLLGQGILGSNVSFHIHLIKGVNTFSCGKSSALIRTIEGKRGYPKLAPPHSAVSGLWERPTIVNNVETFANVPMIISKGAEWYSNIGTQTSKGTKVFSLAGAVKNVGLIEVPMGTSLRDVVFKIGGGPPNKKTKFKAIQVGGPLGGCYSENELDLVIDYETMKRYNSTIGSGGLVVLDHRNCIVDFVKHLMGFVQEETCGKCAPCRLGTEVMYEILDRITKGEACEEDIDDLYKLGEDIHDFTLCGLGQMAPNPVLTSIDFFREEYEAHVKEKTCSAHVCKALHKFCVDETLCAKCGICFKKSCKFEAITWAPKTVAKIDLSKCAKCGVCIQQCPFMAIA